MKDILTKDTMNTTTTIALACIVSFLIVFAIGGALARLKGKGYYGTESER